ncbi:DUF397 domain-containing protein [Streptomyces kunmingensis]|uniref:DUF397 domain-containing protein n=1 Tax=Streptomyces kunmingensis TaxID=68225 RepID=A0ABU6C3W3_9ACTN|nr:DUF397 domain-containing protein [Streptomyces kunmingensis]MEB3959010.1 DUF397 domain-containing protein [Streptomyces kunmingensis]
MKITNREPDLTSATWHKSTYSGGEGNNCLEVAQDFPGAAWRKSTYSGGQGGDCLEVTPDFPGLVPVRDSKDPHGPKLVFRAEPWSAFIADLRRS